MNFTFRTSSRSDIPFFKFWTDALQPNEKKWYRLDDWKLIIELAEQSPDLHLLTAVGYFEPETANELLLSGKLVSEEYYKDTEETEEKKESATSSSKGNSDNEADSAENSNPWENGAARRPNGKIANNAYFSENKEEYVKRFISEEAEKEIINGLYEEYNPYGVKKTLFRKQHHTVNLTPNDDGMTELPIAHFSILYDEFTKNASVDIITAPFMREKGFGNILLSKICGEGNALFGQKKNIPWIAEIDSDNIAAIKCFRNAGFSYKKSNREGRKIFVLKFKGFSLF